MENDGEQRIEIAFSRSAYDKVRQLNTLADTVEWSAFLIGDTDGRTIRVTDLYVPFQKVSEAAVDVDTDKLGDWIAGMSEHHPKDLIRVRGMIHSHVDMTSHYSYVDTDTNDGYSENLGFGKSFVTIVVNRRMEFVAKVLIKLNDGLRFETSDVDVTYEQGGVKVSPELRKIFNERVKVHRYRADNYNYGNYIPGRAGTWDDDGGFDREEDDKDVGEPHPRHKKPLWRYPYDFGY